jgi:DNA-binding NtrC family response regulator
MPDATARPLDDASAGRVLDAQSSFGRARDDWRVFHGLLGQSSAMQALFRGVERLAPHARATLITGDTGAGKSSLAAVVHRLGPCRGGAQITLLGGDDDAEGEYLREAARGARVPVTCFVPELRDLSIHQQAALVRALITSGDLPPGDGLHVIAGTSVEPGDLIARNAVRADLVYRLGAVRFHVPSLHERRDDIAGLATTLLRDACRRLRLVDKAWSGAALALLEDRRWPGNVRELRNVVLRAAALSDDAVIAVHTLREACGPDLDRRADGAAGGRGVDEGERLRVMAALAAVGGNKSAAAVKLGVSRRAFYRLLERLGA